jgi:hypothetical protein
MKRIRDENLINVKKNDYVQLVDSGSNLQSDFNLIDSSVAKSIKDVNYIMLSLGYPPNGWSEDLDVFKFLSLKALLLLQLGKLIFILDGTFEGYGYDNYPIRKSLEKAALKNNINPKLIFFFTGNFKDHSDTINVIPIYNLDREFIRNLSEEKKTIQEIIEACRTTISNKIFLSLSRRNRFHRVLANFIMYNSEIYPHGLISQDVISSFFVDQHTLEKIKKTSEDIDHFKKSLPWIADYDNFSFNDPMNSLYDLHLKTPFSLVNETLTSSENNTSFFYSEKILKPIMAFQPMIIYGQPGINKKLPMLGYTDYSCYFDLSFDDEEDDTLRFQKLLKSITPLVQTLNSMSIADRIGWRFKHQDMLSHNYDVFLKRKNTVEQINKFALIVEKLKI